MPLRQLALSSAGDRFIFAEAFILYIRDYLDFSNIFKDLKAVCQSCATLRQNRPQKQTTKIWKVILASRYWILKLMTAKQTYE